MNDLYPLWLAELAKQDSAMYQAFAIPLIVLALWALWKYVMPFTLPARWTQIVCNCIVGMSLIVFWGTVISVAVIGEKR